jgi:hypothetical protein
MQVQSDYFNAYHNLKLTRDDKGVLVAEFHTNGGPCIMTAQSHTEFVDGFYWISQDRANNGRMDQSKRDTLRASAPKAGTRKGARLPHLVSR